MCDIEIEFTNTTGVASHQLSMIHSAHHLLIGSLGKPVFRKVQAREHPFPSTVISIQGIHLLMIIQDNSLINANLTALKCLCTDMSSIGFNTHLFYTIISFILKSTEFSAEVQP